MPSVKVVIIIAAVATLLAIRARAAEKFSWHPKLVHRQIASRWTLALKQTARIRPSLSAGRTAMIIVWFFAICVLGNAIWHLLPTLKVGGYFPGLYTSFPG